MALAGRKNPERAFRFVSSAEIGAADTVVGEQLFPCAAFRYPPDFEDIRVCVGSIHSSGEIGYLVKKVKTIPTAHNLLGAVDAIYEIDGTDDEEGCRYYAVWVITN